MNNLVVSSWQESFFVAVATILTNIISYIPTILGAILVFLLGMILSKWMSSLVVKFLGLIKLSSLFQKVGFSPFLQKAEIKVKLEEIIGGIVRWLVILIFFVTAVNILGLTTVSLVLNNILGYIPRVISAILILALGVLLAGFVESFVKGTLVQVDLKVSLLLGKVASYLVVIFSTLVAINELGIAQSFINILFMGVVAALSLGLGLSFGLGAKDLVGSVLEDWYKNFKKK